MFRGPKGSVRDGSMGHVTSGRVGPIFLGILLGAAPAMSQERGTLAGSVRDSLTGAPIEGAIISAIAPDENSFQTLSRGDGTFRIELGVGTYTLNIASPGWFTVRREDQLITRGRTVTIEIVMAPSPIQLDHIVVTPSRMPEKLTDAPAAVEIAREREIEERPSTTIVDHVKGKAGVDVVTTGLQSHNVVLRGFNNVLSGGLLALTDYRIARIPALRANVAYLNPTTSLDLREIEVVLGPGSALYGPNADNGVIHSITKSPIDDPGVSLSIAGGLREQAEGIGSDGAKQFEASNEGVFHGEGRVAVRAGEKLGIKLSGQYFAGTDYRFVDDVESERGDAANACIASGPELASDACLSFAKGLDLARPADRELLLHSVRNVARGRNSHAERWSLDGQVAWRPGPGTSLVVSGGRSTAVDAVDLTTLGAVQVIDWAYDYAQVRFRSRNLFAQVFLNKNDNSDTYLLRSGRPLVDRSEQWVGQLQHASTLGARHHLVYGVEALHTNPKTEGTINGRFEDDDTITELGGYLQWHWAVDPRLDVVGAARVDHSSRLGDPVFSPRAAVVFKPRPGHSLRASLNRSFSTPSSVSLFLDISGGTIPLGGPFTYDVRATGSSGEGFTFARSADGVPKHQSPFAPLMSGSPRDFLPTTTMQLWNEAVALISAQDPRTGQLLGAIPAPGGADVPVVAAILDPDEGTFTPVPGGLGAISDFPELDPSTTTTLEIGYKGLLGGKVLLSANAWYSRVNDKISDQRVISPNVFLEEGALAGYLSDRFLDLVGAVFADEDEARAAAVVAAATIGAIPLGVVTPEQAGGTASTIVLADRNLPSFDLFGGEIGARLYVGGRWEAETALSLVSDSQFASREATVTIVPLNAPTVKGTATIRYRDDQAGVNGQLRFRVQNGFAANSGVYSGDVEGFGVLDLGIGYRMRGLRGVWLQLDIQNLLDHRYRSFVGAPELGRFIILRARYDLPFL